VILALGTVGGRRDKIDDANTVVRGQLGARYFGAIERRRRSARSSIAYRVLQSAARGGTRPLRCWRHRPTEHRREVRAARTGVRRALAEMHEPARSRRPRSYRRTADVRIDTPRRIDDAVREIRGNCSRIVRYIFENNLKLVCI